MKLSINVITYNRKQELLRALESLINQSFKDYELIIVDNASTDGTDKAVETFKEQYCNMQINYEKQNDNLGVSGGRNRAFILSNGEYIFTFDDDAVIEDKDFLSKAINMLDNDGTIAVAAVKIFEPETNEYLPYTIRTIDNKKNVLSYKGGANFIRTSFYKNQKTLYPEKLFFGSEELYPSLLAWGANKRVAYFEDLEVLHIPSKINRYIGKERALNIIINSYIIYRLVYPYITYPILNFFLFIRLIKFGLLKDIKKILSIFNERFDKKDKTRIGVKGVLKLIKIFGLKRVL